MQEFKKRKTTHLAKHDYSLPGGYFLTFCTNRRKNILSRIDKNSGELTLTPYGQIVEQYIQKIPNQFQYVLLKNYVIMPNHVHLLLVIQKENEFIPSVSTDRIIGWLKFQSTKAINQTFKKQIGKLFQRSFHDHIIRNDKDYTEIYNYICENPIHWYYDKLYRED